MIGVVLCGGKSTRMGTDKGLLKLHAGTWAQTAFDKLSTLQVPVLLSVNNDQLPAYRQVFPGAELVCDKASLEIRGPLSGVLSTHLTHPGKDLFVLACDLPLMEETVLQEILAAYRKQPLYDVWLFKNDSDYEPLCGIYSAGGLARVSTMYDNGQLAKHSMKYILEHLDVFSVPLKEEYKKAFRNFNAHAELNGL